VVWLCVLLGNCDRSLLLFLLVHYGIRLYFSPCNFYFFMS
jgi:hypothetical protein